MIVRASELFLPTLRDDPADAEAVSHKLLVRGGFIRQVSAGLWTFMTARLARPPEDRADHPRGARRLRRHRRSSCRVLTPAELWEATGRITIPELFRLKDRTGRDYILPLTHEETVAFHAREIQSYKELPQIWYHLQTKDRDEPRPRGALLRVREFVMKDGVLVRPRRGGARRELPQALRRVQADLRALRGRGLRGRGRVRDHGRQRQPGLPRALRLGREHARDLRERRLRGRPRDRRGPAFPSRLPAGAGRARGGGHAGVTDDRCRLASSSASTPAPPRRRCPWWSTEGSCSRSCAATTGSTR